jgi:hypothetical protein
MGEHPNSALAFSLGRASIAVASTQGSVSSSAHAVRFEIVVPGEATSIKQVAPTPAGIPATSYLLAY